MDGPLSDGDRPAGHHEPTDDPTEREAGIERGTVATNGIDTFYERRGEGPPVVFVHGAIMDHSMWGPQVEALSDEYTTVAYDVRGHGRTGGSDRDAYSVELFAEDLAALVSALELERPVVCGISLGGCIAGTYAARHPDAVGGLVLADTFTPELDGWRERIQLAALKGTILPVRLFGYPRVQAAMTWVQDRLFDRGARGEYATVERLQAEMPPIADDEFAKVIRATAGFVDAEVDLAAIAVPTLVLYGENTTGAVKGQVRLFAARIPDVTVREVPGGGHACNLDAPEFFSAAVREYLAGIDDGDGPE